MEITMNNRHNPAYEAMLDELIQEIFGFSFAPWFSRGLWDERYESWSVVENGRMLSNICLFKADLLVGGKSARAHQLGAVATRRSQRERGLSRRLMEYVLACYPDTPAYLAANPSVTGFYPRFGFQSEQTFRPELSVRLDNPESGAVRLGPDDETVIRLLAGRHNPSGLLDCLNALPVQRFHLLLDHPEGILYLPRCEALVVAEQEGERLFIAGVASEGPVSFEALCRELPFTGVRRVEFGFCPDMLGVEPRWIPEDMESHPFFLRGDWSLPERFRFPVLSET